MTTWFTSDLHFGHVNILKYGRSEFFSDLDEMRERLILNWNGLINEDDTVYVLGDVVMGQRDKNLPILGRLNGNKILILGNHDYPHPSNREKTVDKWTPIYGEYFDEMHVDLEYTFKDPLRFYEETALLVHFPADGDHTEEVRYEEWRPDYDGLIIHGHLHCEEKVVAQDHIHIGIDSDWTDFGLPRYSPIPEELIIQLILAED